MKKNYILYIFILFRLIFNQGVESIQNEKEIAKAYYDAGLYEDAIVTYKNILNVQKNILGNLNLELTKTLFVLSDLNLIQENFEEAEIEKYKKQS